MGFFSKLKKFVGKTDVKLDYEWIENPFPFDDPMIKATIRIKAEGEGVTVIGTTGTFIAQRTNGDGVEEEIVLGEEVSNTEDCADVERDGEWVEEFPEFIESGQESSYGLFIDDMDLPKSLAEWGVRNVEDAKAGGVKFILKGEIDVKETADLFDPSLDYEITVV